MPDLKELQKKILLIGDAAVGKTSLVKRYVVNKFDDKYIVTIGSKVTAKAIHFENEGETVHMKLQIWDILGQKGYKKLLNSSFRGTAGVFLVADITRRETLDSLENYWLPNLLNIVGNIPFIILANKSDLINQAEFNEQDLRHFADKYDAPYYLTSAKSGENVDRAFLILGKRMLRPVAFGPLPSSKVLMPEEIYNNITELIDKIIDDFCNEFNRPVDAMHILRKQFEIAGLDLNNPTEETLKSAVERLAIVETGFKDREIAEANLKKRLKWIKEST
ncbi:MAG: GTP-binding protein [Thermoplasmata archaeon]|nr:MAG: GTP-binding protein [Thermoplasmata archaeon]